MVVLTYRRRKMLKRLIESLLDQQLGGLNLELIICNNAPNEIIQPSPFSGLGRLLRRVPDLKIINSSHNWKTDIRYLLAQGGKYETILFLDDDMVLKDKHFIADYYKVFMSLGKFDILSGFNELWTRWESDYLEFVSITFWTRGINDLIRCDICGPGICMFNKQILQSREMLEGLISKEFPKADDMAFGPVAHMVWGSTVYYYPIHGRILFDEEVGTAEGRLYLVNDHLRQMYAFYKSLLANGYKPVLERLANEPTFLSLPENKYAQSFRNKRVDW